MKRTLRIVMMSLVVFAPYAYADSVPTFNIYQAVLTLSPSVGGDNELFFFGGPGIGLVGGGTAVCFWCNTGALLLPGSSLTPSISIATFDFIEGTAITGGHTYNLFGGVLFSSSITALSSFTFPTNGQSNFTVSVPALLGGPIQGSAPSLFSFNLQIPTTGTLVLTFHFVPNQDAYFFTGGRFSIVPVPEPGTLAMVGSGVCGIAGMMRRKLKRG